MDITGLLIRQTAIATQYSNASPDFSDLEGIEPTQSFDLVETSSPVTYNVR